MAAAEILRKRLALRDDAAMLLERAIALDPGSMEALEALEAVTVEAGNFERLADVLERRLEIGPGAPSSSRRSWGGWPSSTRDPWQARTGRATRRRGPSGSPSPRGCGGSSARGAPPGGPTRSRRRSPRRAARPLRR